MTPLGHKRLSITLSIIALILALLAAWGWFRAIMSEVHVMLADGHTQMLEEVRDAALEYTSAVKVADALRWIGQFYRPSEPPVSPVEHRCYNLEERVRVAYQQDLVAHLRRLTGDDLGDDPKSWVEKYAKPER